MLTRVNVLYRSATRKEQIFIIVRIDAKDDVVGKKEFASYGYQDAKKAEEIGAAILPKQISPMRIKD